jgi:3-hydroxyisobutyrate dehydrogenase-like beta-hydroxyacid dehydrogenase
MNVAFVGLGAMGSAMATNVLASGHSLVVYNRTRARADAYAAKGARVASSPKEAARDAEIVFTMLADDAAVEAVTFGDDGVLAGLSQGGVHVSASTISVALSERLAEAHAKAGQGYVSAPVFGRPDAAAAKQLWLLAAGASADVDKIMPVLSALGRGVTRLGEHAPAANVVKLSGNFVIASMLETLGEAFALTRKWEIDPAVFCDVFVNVFARSAIFEGYAKRIATEAYVPPGFTTELGLKDVRFALAAAEARNVPMPIASLVRDNLLAAVAQGRTDLDWSAVARFAAERAGLK